MNILSKKTLEYSKYPYAVSGSCFEFIVQLKSFEFVTFNQIPEEACTSIYVDLKENPEDNHCNIFVSSKLETGLNQQAVFLILQDQGNASQFFS